MAAWNSLVDTCDDEDIQEKLKPAIEALEVNKRREKDKTHYEFDGKVANGKYALLSTVVQKVISYGITPQQCSQDYSKALSEFTNKDSKSAYDTIESLLRNNNVVMTCPSHEELFDPKKIIRTDLVFSENDYQKWWKPQGKKKEVYNKEGNIRILNQWGYDTIDYFIYAFYVNREKWKLQNKEIKVIKQISV